MKISEWYLKMNDNIEARLNKISAKADKLGGQTMSKLQSKFDDFGNRGAKAFTKVNDKIGALKKGLADAANELPAFASISRFISAPMAGAIGLVAGLVSGLGVATSHAADFNHEFLQLKQLNLGKSAAEINALKKDVYDTAFSKGFDLKATSKAFFDIQSATGKYGKEVKSIVSDVGEFAMITSSDMDASIGATAKAMNAFKLGAADLEKFQASSFKTVQTGITTFDELARVQTEYAGAAAAAGQDFDNANKLFAQFTSASKNPEIAAMLTKTAFQDLTKKSTVDGFKKIGISVFDANKNMRSMDNIVRDLVPKLAKMDDMQFGKLKEEIGGSEGLRALLDNAKNSGEGFIGLMNRFDETKFNRKSALENALNDPINQSRLAINRFNTAITEFGEKVLPLATDLLKKVNSILDVYNKGKNLNNGYDAFVAYTKKKGINAYDNIDKQGNQYEKDISFGEDLFSRYMSDPAYRKKIDLRTGFVKRESSGSGMPSFMNGGSLLDKFTKGAKEELSVMGFPVTGTGAKATAAGVDSGLANDISKGIDNISGGGKVVRNVTVNIGKFQDNINITAATVKESAGEIARMIEEAMIRAVRGAELAAVNE